MKLISIFKLPRKKKDVYYADFSYNGRVKRISLKVNTKDEAVKAWNDHVKNFEAEKEKLRYENILYSKPIDDGFTEYFNFKKSNVQASTIKRDKSLILKFKNFLLSNKIEIIKDIDESILKAFLSLLESENKSHKTLKNYITTTNNILKYFKGKDYLPQYIHFEVPKHWRKSTKEKMQIINKDEGRLIVDEFIKINDLQRKCFLLFPFYTGMRFSEVRGLNRKNIDFDKRLIIVCEKWTDATDKPETILKSIAGYRRVPIMTEIYQILLDFVNSTDKEYIFNDLTYNKVKTYTDKIKAKYNIDFNYHQARHFFASLLIDSKKFSVKQIQVILGHEDITTTLNTYGHLIQDWKIEDFDKINF